MPQEPQTANPAPVSTQAFSFPRPSPRLEAFGLKFTDGGAHVSKTMMLAELTDLLAAVSAGASPEDYRAAVLERNVLGKTTDSTRKKTLRHMRELYGLDEGIPIFRLLRKLALLDRGESLPLLAIQLAWSRDALLRASTPAVLDASVGESVEPASLASALHAAFPAQYAESTLQTTTRNAASSWAQAGHLVGRLHKFRAQVKPTPVAVTMALFLGHVAGYHGGEVFKSPWVRLLDLGADRARTMAMEAHRAGLLNLRSVGDVVDLSFPMLDMIQSEPS